MRDKARCINEESWLAHSGVKITNCLQLMLNIFSGCLASRPVISLDNFNKAPFFIFGGRVLIIFVHPIVYDESIRVLSRREEKSTNLPPERGEQCYRRSTVVDSDRKKGRERNSPPASHPTGEGESKITQQNKTTRRGVLDPPQGAIGPKDHFKGEATQPILVFFSNVTNREWTWCRAPKRSARCHTAARRREGYLRSEN